MTWRCWRLRRRISASWRWRNPDLLDHVSTIVSTRRTGLEDAKAHAAAVVVPEAKQNFLARMRRFLNI